jgi:mono/diheme cytochrome c family protein
MKTVGIIVATLAAEFLIAIIFINSGLYNVSVTSPDPRPLRWVFSRTSDNSVEHHAKGIAVPSLTDSSMINEGFDHYDEMCVGCHGAPGIERSEIGKGLYPHGPNLAHSAKELEPAEMFWVVKNGIKSTGMPGFGLTHSDQKIWSIVSFLEKMKDMTPQDYKAMQKIPGQEKKESMKNMDMPTHGKK